MTQKRLVAIHIDANLCVGSGMCVSAHPDKFALQPDGHAIYIGSQPEESVAREAEELCPVSAISLVYAEEEAP
ncbi:MAG: ferredoxin [Luteibacter sp.]